MFFFLRNSSPLFSITRSGSFFVINVSVSIKNNAEKYTTLLLFFLFKSPGGRVISFQIKPRVAFRLPCLLIELFYIGMPVVWTDGQAGGRSVGRSVYVHVTTKFCRMSRLPYFLSYGAPLTRGVSAPGRAPLLPRDRSSSFRKCSSNHMIVHPTQSIRYRQNPKVFSP